MPRPDRPPQGPRGPGRGGVAKRRRGLLTLRQVLAADAARHLTPRIAVGLGKPLRSSGTPPRPDASRRPGEADRSAAPTPWLLGESDTESRRACGQPPRGCRALIGLPRAARPGRGGVAKRRRGLLTLRQVPAADGARHLTPRIAAGLGKPLRPFRPPPRPDASRRPGEAGLRPTPDPSLPRNSASPLSPPAPGRAGAGPPGRRRVSPWRPSGGWRDRRRRCRAGRCARGAGPGPGRRT
jgi:hypothetical protein